MGIILTEFLHAEETVQFAGLFLTVDHIHLADTERQFPIGAGGLAVNVDSIRAVHRLGRVGGGAFRVINAVAGVIRLIPRDQEHIVAVMSPVAGGHPQLFVVDDRSRDLLIVMFLMNGAPVFQQRIIQPPAARQPVGHPWSGFIAHEELKLWAELLVVAFLCFFDELQMIGQFFLVFEGIDVDTLQLVPVFVTAPVGTGNGPDLESGAEQFLGIADVRSAAEIEEIITREIDRQLFAFRQVVDKFDFEFLVSKEFEGVGAGHFLYLPVFFPFEDLAHFVFDHRIVFRGQVARQQKVIVKTVSDLRTDGDLDMFLTEDLHDGLRQDMGKGMAVYARIIFLVFLFVHQKLLLLLCRKRPMLVS